MEWRIFVVPAAGIYQTRTRAAYWEHASEAENRASEEARARREAEAELEKLRAALERLQSSQ